MFSELTLTQLVCRAPTHIGDPPGDGVITFGVILPLSKLAPNDECGEEPFTIGIMGLEGFAWSLQNARSMYARSGLKIGTHFDFPACLCPQLA